MHVVDRHRVDGRQIILNAPVFVLADPIATDREESIPRPLAAEYNARLDFGAGLVKFLGRRCRRGRPLGRCQRPAGCSLLPATDRSSDTPI